MYHDVAHARAAAIEVRVRRLIGRARMPKTRRGQFVYGFCDQFLYFFIVCANFRAVAIGLKCATAGTDVLITAQAFISKKLAIDKEEARTWWVGAGEAVGGGLGSILSIYVTQKLFGR
jgi:hypothetical protein